VYANGQFVGNVASASVLVTREPTFFRDGACSGIDFLESYASPGEKLTAWRRPKCRRCRGFGKRGPRTCSTCNGSGRSGPESRKPIYTKAQLKRLDEIAAKRRATLAAKAEVDRPERERRRKLRRSALQRDPFYLDLVRYGDRAAALARLVAVYTDREFTAKQRTEAERLLELMRDHDAKAPTSRWLGDPGDRIDLSAKVVARYPCGQGRWGGKRFLVKLETPDEQSVLWFTGREDVLPGLCMVGRATVRGQRQYHGRRETDVYRLHIREEWRP
jgi:hypothetical protein